ncbi:Sec-independent protein translocase protein TatB [Thiocapsa roseopersicina]|uniref:Sec-independent protein translocase protein TatB n=1 Tax=Thiocapsa roseopersicina TaxID=1058 RepID=A0A1H2V6M2_THIRO|nr:Sec-independent protein translocase protein TatB [Thiocapsa roseopersicina]SDW63945.1 sec-independent protein translocase protein TatB [Thiocapsa roseopersicina]
MFDMGFWELVVIGVVALVVIGPERLPKVARIAGLWLGRARRTLASVQDEIRRELKADELKEILDKQARSRPLESILEEPAKRNASPASGTESAREPQQGQPSAGLGESTSAARPTERDAPAS